jgi:hypothetical protein
MKLIEIIGLCLGTGFGSAWITAWYTKKETNAKADKIIGDAYGSLITNLRDEVDRLYVRVSNQEQRELKYLEMISNKDSAELALRKRIKELESEIKSLASEITNLRLLNKKSAHE